MSDTSKRCPICNGRGALRCDCWPGDCICGWDDEPCDMCSGTGWLDDHGYDDDLVVEFYAGLAAAMASRAPHVGMPPRSRKIQQPKLDKRAKVKAARAQNVKRKRK